MSIIRLFDELTDLEKLSIIPMSYSRLNTASKCGQQYYLSYIEKIPQGFSAPAAAGNVVHDVLEHTDVNDMDLDDMLARLESTWEKYDPDNLIDEELKGAMRDCVSSFHYDNESSTFDVVDTELSFEVVIGSYLFRGYIDRVDRIKDGILVTDYKTGKHQVAAKAAPFDFQLGLYGAVCRLMFPEAKKIRSELYYMRPGKKIGHTYTNEDLDSIEMEILKASNRVRDTLTFLPTQEQWICKHLCSYGKSGDCARGKTVLGKW